MNIKMLLFPLAIILAIYLIIFQTVPDFKEIKQKHSEISTKEAELASVSDKNRNIQSMKSSMEMSQNSQLVALINSYLPGARNEEQVINILNNLAVGSSLGLSKIEVIVKTETAKSKEELASSSEKMKEAMKAEPGKDKVSADPYDFKAETFEVKATVFGKYENIRDYVTKVYTSEVFNRPTLISIKKIEAKAAAPDQPAPPADQLMAELKMELSYLPVSKISKNYSAPIFDKSSLDFDIATRLGGKIKNKVPAIQVGQTGRDNPFFP